MMDVSAALQNLSSDLSFDEKTAIRRELSIYLNYLLINDFSALVQLLYRIDVSEKKLRMALSQNKEADAGDLLSELIFERQRQKYQHRSSILPPDDIPEEDSW